MPELHALVAAAGRGTRAGLPYPKTLFPVLGKPILIRIAELLDAYDSQPTVIVSPEGEDPVRECLQQHGRIAHLVVQPEPRGMGDAVLHFAHSPAYPDSENVLLVWGDIPFIQPETLRGLVQAHEDGGNDFTFVTRNVESAYTVVARDAAGVVVGVVESREEGTERLQAGERDIGLFVFRKTPIIEMLQQDLAGKYGKLTGEHGFLYVIGHLARLGFKVEALPIATALDLVSLNSLRDIDGYI
jgi:bifunctional UDP-N-acetylglucosamine pyrophosphorylase/glucosamine-1-phosphate N-acetyltransferase